MTASDEWRKAAHQVKDWDYVEPEGDFETRVEEALDRLDVILNEETLDKIEPEDYPRDDKGRPIPPPPAFEKRKPDDKRRGSSVRSARGSVRKGRRGRR